MQNTNITRFQAGSLRRAYKYSYFLPNQINSQHFIINDDKLQSKLEKVTFKLGELNSFARFIPDLNIFIKSYVMKESLTSSRIEGTQTNIQEAFSDELDLNPEHRDDWNEVNSYVDAMNYALKRLNKLPLSNRLIKETHKILLSNNRGKNKNPGEFRSSQNWIGGKTIQHANFIPPSSEHVDELMSDLEKFLHNDKTCASHLIKIAIAHYQFETIHPFLDGNGRVGRMLITLYLIEVGLLEKPLLYLSDFFEKNRHFYFDKLTTARTKNDLLGWINFFLQALEKTAESAVKTLQDVIILRDKIIAKKIPNLGRRAKVAQEFLDILFSHPVMSVASAQRHLNLSPKAIHDLFNEFVRVKILAETTGQKRNRLFVFRDYLKILER